MRKVETGFPLLSRTIANELITFRGLDSSHRNPSPSKPVVIEPSSMLAHLPPIAVFDLDGTLADTAGDLVATLNMILEQEGLAPLPLEKARDMIGAGARAL